MDYSNQRYSRFMNNEPESPPIIPYNEYGIRFVPSGAENKIGDIVVRDTELTIVALMNFFCKGIASIITTFFNPSPDEAQAVYPIPFTEPVIHLLYRFLTGIMDCSEMLALVDSRSMEHIKQCTINYSKVLSRLPLQVKRQVLSAILPHLYKSTKKNTLLIEFLTSFLPTSDNSLFIVLIDFITNHLHVFIVFQSNE